MNHAVRAPGFGTRRWQSSPENWLGPYLITTAIETMFLGICCNQVWIYFSCFPKDPVWLKRTVGLVLLLSIIKTIQSLCVSWAKLIMGFPSWERAAKVGWAIHSAPTLIAMLSSAAQVFFIWRCYVLTDRNRYLLVALYGALLTQLALAAGLSAQITVDMYDGPAVGRWAKPWHGSAIALDCAITFIVSYKLIKSRRGDHQNTDTILTKLLKVTWESALPPAIAEATVLVVYTYTVSSFPNWNYMSSALTPRLYVFSLMYTLNSRLEIRQFSLRMGAEDCPRRTEGAAVEVSEVRFRPQPSDSRTFSTSERTGQIPPAGLVDVEHGVPAHKDTHGTPSHDGHVGSLVGGCGNAEIKHENLVPVPARVRPFAAGPLQNCP